MGHIQRLFDSVRFTTEMFSTSRLWLFTVISLVAFAGAARAATYTAASCNQSDVNAVINGPTHTAVDGDTIHIPAGTCRWTSPLSVTKGVSIIGAGASSTIIQDGQNGTLFQVGIPSATS